MTKEMKRTTHAAGDHEGSVLSYKKIIILQNKVAPKETRKRTIKIQN